MSRKGPRTQGLAPALADSGPTSWLPPSDPAVARVGACAVGLAYVERPSGETVDRLIDLAGGRIAVLAAARERIRALEGLDRQVLDRAVGLMNAAIRGQQQRGGMQRQGTADG